MMMVMLISLRTANTSPKKAVLTIKNALSINSHTVNSDEYMDNVNNTPQYHTNHTNSSDDQKINLAKKQT